MTHIEKNEYYHIIHEVLKSDEFQKRKQYCHHGNITVYEHSLRVSKLSYVMAKKLKKDYKTAALAGLLHDFYYHPWQENRTKEKFFQAHGFTHAKEARLNAYSFFPELMNDRIEDAILKHMFPLNKGVPRYVESWIVTLADKYISCEVFKHPKTLPSLIGFKKKERKI